MNDHIPEPFRSILNTAAAVPIQAAQLAERAEKADARRFTGEAPTGFGELAEHAGETSMQRAERLILEALAIAIDLADHPVAGEALCAVWDSLNEALGRLGDVRFAEAGPDEGEAMVNQRWREDAAAINRSNT